VERKMRRASLSKSPFFVPTSGTSKESQLWLKLIEEETLLLVSKLGFTWTDVRRMPAYKRKLYLSINSDWMKEEKNRSQSKG
jgi:hypothetical protein